MSELAGYAGSPTMGFDNGFGYRQSHPRSLHAESLIPPAVELIKHKRLLEVIDARPTISDTCC